MKNRYGGPLRALVARDFHLSAYVDIVDTPAFHSDVVAYPAITVIAREKGKITRMAYRPEIEQHALATFADCLRSKASPATSSVVREAIALVAACIEEGITKGAHIVGTVIWL